MKFYLLSLKTYELSNKLVYSILKLKNSHWKTSIKSQKNFFLKNCRRNDLHTIVKYKNLVLGYTMLRKRKLDKGKLYLLFDTIIIDKKFRNKGYANILMSFNNQIITNENIPSILFCDSKLIKFYKKFKWKVSNFKDLSSGKYIMTYNYKKLYKINLSSKINNLREV